MRLIYEDNRYIALCNRGEGAIAQRAGFSRTSKNRQYWYTRDPFIASKLIRYVDKDTRHIIEIECNKRNISYDMSRASESISNIHIPCPDGLEYLPYQKAGIEFALRRPNTLIADEMGLGKTIQALGYINARGDWLDRILWITPASLKINTLRECEKWLVTNHSAGIVDRQNHLNTNICIINYDILYNYDLLKIDWDLLILDEAHYFKNENSKRTRYIYCLDSKYKLFLTGTPMLNRPIELWSILNYLDPINWPLRLPYSKYFCCGHKGRYGWEENGASHMDELNRELRETIMLRRLKRDVLPQLPPKRRQIIEIDSGTVDEAITKELGVFVEYQEALNKLENLKKNCPLPIESEKDYDNIYFNANAYRSKIKKLETDIDVMFHELVQLRKEAAFKKLPFIVNHIETMLHNTDKLIVFGYHREVLETYHERFKDISILVYGGADGYEKQRRIDIFQSDPNCKILFCSIEVAVGFNITAASNIIFAEWDWVPAKMNQAEDRCHRIGQLFSVLIQYTVLANSADVIMAKQLVRKQEVIEAALD